MSEICCNHIIEKKKKRNTFLAVSNKREEKKDRDKYQIHGTIGNYVYVCDFMAFVSNLVEVLIIQLLYS